MSVEDTIKKIRQACTDMEKAYADLAKMAKPAMDQLQTAIGNLYQWKYTLYPRGSTKPVVEYRDTRYNWFERYVLLSMGGGWTEEHVPHPRAEEARQRVRELLGKANANDEVFEARVSSIAETPRKVADTLEVWLRVRDSLSKKVGAAIPSDPAYIPTTAEEGWESPLASSAYGAIVSSQNRAADGARQVISGLIDNSAKFLASIEQTLAAYANQTVELNKYYTNIISGAGGLLKKPDFSTITGLIDEGFKVVNGLAEKELREAKDFASMLNRSIEAMLAIEKLNGDIDALSERETDQGWPAPIAIKAAPPDGTPDHGELVMDARYFTDHAKFWDDISGDLKDLSSQAKTVPDIPTMFTKVPTFSADQSTALNKLADRITDDVLSQGSRATAELADKLRAARHDYLMRELQNEQEVRAIEQELD